MEFCWPLLSLSRQAALTPVKTVARRKSNLRSVRAGALAFLQRSGAFSLITNATTTTTDNPPRPAIVSDHTDTLSISNRNTMVVNKKKSSSWISSNSSIFLGGGDSNSRRPLVTSRQRLGGGSSSGASNRSKTRTIRRFICIVTLGTVVIGLLLFVSIHQMNSLQTTLKLYNNINNIDQTTFGGSHSTKTAKTKSKSSLISSSSLLSHTLDERAMILETSKIPFYVYDEPNLTLSNNQLIDTFLNVCTKSLELCDTYIPDCYDALSEQSALNALKQHPWNVNRQGDNGNGIVHINRDDDNKMMIHIIPTPMVSLMYTRNGNKPKLDENNCIKFDVLSKKQKEKIKSTEDVFDTLFGSLVKQPHYKQQNNGHLHVLLTIHHDLFASHRIFKIPKLGDWYKAIENITVAHHYDAIECQHVFYQNQEKYEKYTQLQKRMKRMNKRNKKMKAEKRLLTKEVVQLQQSIQFPDYMETLKVRKPVVKHVFVLGLGIADISMPLQIPTLGKYTSPTPGDDTSYFIFYRTRTKPSRYNSTIYRLAPLNDIDATQHPIFDIHHSSIGYDIPHDIWVKHMSKSKFCLAIRGDTPHTHALIRSIRSGCIPVVISDLYPLFASSFANILKMDEYCIIISEKEFINNPTQTLLNLNNLSKEYLQQKLNGLKLAQRILFPDHPKSLFVQAFLQQTHCANSKQRKWWNDGISDGSGYYDTPLP